MKLTEIFFIILYQSIVLWPNVRGDHVQIIGCSKEPRCLNNLNKRLLKVIEENLETSTQPCEHFWNYSCGSWTSAPYNDHVDNFGAISNYYADQLIETLRELQWQDSKIATLVNQLMKYFQACKTLKVLSFNFALYLQELPGINIFGKSFRWDHLFQEDIWQDFDWLKAAAFLRRYGLKDLFLQESAGFARHNSQQYVVQLKIPRPQISFRDKYQVLQIMDKFKLSFNSVQAKGFNLQLADEIVQYDNKMQVLYEKFKNVKENYRISLQHLPRLFRRIDWQLYFQLLLKRTFPAETVVEFSGNFDYFEELLALFRQTSKRVQGIYTLLKFCQYLIEIRPTVNDRECMLHTNVMFPVGVEYIYDRFLYRNRIADEKVLQFIFSMLKTEFDKVIRENKFLLSAFEIEQLIEKLQLLRLKIGNLPAVFNDESINYYYSQVQLATNNFYHNHLEMLKFRTWQQHQPLVEPSLSSAGLDSYYVNDDISELRNAPYFIHKRNMIIVPLVFLQLPFYHYAQHPVLQFSLVGWILGHEMSHGFDAHGLDFDGWGNEKSWGNEKLSSGTSFSLAMQCLEEHSAAVSLNERMADINGLQLAYQAFFLHVPRTLDVLPLKRLFFVNFAQFFCGTLPRAIGHDRDDIRVRQSIANMKEFGKVFQCSATAKENPPHKCRIWKT